MPTDHSHSLLLERLNSQIKAVVFDAVGTVMFAMPSVATVYCDTLQRLTGQTVDAKTVRRVLMERLAARSQTSDLSTSEPAERQFWFDVILELCPVKSQQTECFDALYDHFASAENWRCYDDVNDCLAGLRARQMKIIIASNFDERLHRVCGELHDLDTVDHCVVSSEVGWRKPARQFFKAVCERAGCLPHEILFVGDDPHSDIAGAHSFGMPAVWINRNGEPSSTIEQTTGTRGTTEVWSIGTLRELHS